MALTRASVLHYWSSRYGPIPIVGGIPHHTRNSAAKWVDGQGVLQDAIVNTPRSEWADIASERRPVMRLEQARTNNMLYGNDLANAAWTKTNVTVAGSKPDPSGGTSAFSVTATAGNGEIAQLLAAGSNIKRTNSAWLRRRTGTGGINLQDQDGNNLSVAVSETWQRFVITSAAASTSRSLGVRLISSGDAVDMYLPQQDDAESASSTIATGAAAATRAADSFYFDHTPPPQAVMIYSRIVERGTATGALKYLWSLGDGAARIFCYNDGGGGYRINYHNGSSVLETANQLASNGDKVETIGVLTGAGGISIIQSLNEAAVTSATPGGTAALPATWTSQKAWLNSNSTTGPGLADFAEFKVVKHGDVAGATAQEIMNELRAFELNAAGEVMVDA